jgi:hypothetical protein
MFIPHLLSFSVINLGSQRLVKEFTNMESSRKKAMIYQDTIKREDNGRQLHKET